MMEEGSRYTAKLRLNRPFAKVYAVGSNTKISREGNAVSMETENIHEIVVYEDD